MPASRVWFPWDTGRVGQSVDRLGQCVERGHRSGQSAALPGGQRRKGQVEHGGVRCLPRDDRLPEQPRKTKKAGDSGRTDVNPLPEWLG